MKRTSLAALSLGMLLFPLIPLYSQGYVFGPNVRVSDYPIGSAYAWTPKSGQRGVAVRGDTVYCVWSDTRAGRHNWFAKSVDGGQTFLTNVMVDDGVGPSASPTIAVGNDGTIYVAFEYAGVPYSFVQVYFAKSTDGGLTFTPDVVVNDTANGIKNYPHRFPSMAVDSSGIIYITFDDYRNARYDIYFSKSTNGGTTFLPDVLVNDSLPGDTTYRTRPGLSIDNSENVYVVWQDDRYHSWRDILFSKSTDGGVTFLPDVVVSDTDSCVYRLDASANVDSRGFIHTVWYEFDTNSNIFYSRSTDGGLTFNPQIMVNDTINEPEPQGSPSFCVDDSGIVYAVWENGPGTVPDIYFTLSTDSGDSAFVEPDVLVDETDSTCWGTSVAVDDSGVAYVLWKDFRNSPFTNDVFLAVGQYDPGVKEIRVEEGRISISTPFPNPFNIRTVIKFRTPGAEHPPSITLKVYDVSGRLVKALVEGSPATGLHEISWDGRDESGKRVSPGVYFIRMETESFLSTKKVLLVR